MINFRITKQQNVNLTKAWIKEVLGHYLSGLKKFTEPQAFNKIDLIIILVEKKKIVLNY